MSIPPTLIANAIAYYDKVDQIALKLQGIHDVLLEKKQNIMLLTRNMGKSGLDLGMGLGSW